MTRSRWGRAALSVAVLVAVLAAAHAARQHVGVPASIDGLRDRVAGLGWWGPTGLLAVMVFRQFLVVPSALLLTVAGVCFDLPTATALGTAGLVLSALLSFLLARGVLRDWVAGTAGSRARRLGAVVERVGPAFIALSTAHPLGLLTPLHWAAGLSTLPLRAFLAALLAGAPARAFLYALFGSALADPGSPAFRVAMALGVGAVAVLAVPAVRRRVLGR